MLVSSCLLLSPVKLVGGGGAPLLSHIDSDHSPDEQRCKSVPQRRRQRQRQLFRRPSMSRYAEPCWHALNALSRCYFLSIGAICTITHITNFATSSSIMFYFRDNRFHNSCAMNVFFGWKICQCYRFLLFSSLQMSRRLTYWLSHIFISRYIYSCHSHSDHLQFSFLFFVQWFSL